MTLKNVQDCLLLSYMEGFLDEEEFCALYDVNSTDYPVFEHGKYRRFDLNEVSEEECFSRFRFSHKVIPYLGRILRLPEKFVCENPTAAYTEEGLCILLQRFCLSMPLSRHDSSVWEVSIGAQSDSQQGEPVRPVERHETFPGKCKVTLCRKYRVRLLFLDF